MRDETNILLTRWEFRAVFAEIWALAVAAGTGTSWLFNRLVPTEGLRPLGAALGLFLAALAAYPIARAWCRRIGREVAPSRYLAAWLAAAVVLMTGLALTTG